MQLDCRAQLNRLVDVVVSDESIVEFILANVNENVPIEYDVNIDTYKNAIDTAVDIAFTSMNIWEMVANVKKEIERPAQEESDPDVLIMESSTESSVIPLPEFSKDEPIQVTDAPGRRYHDYMNNEKKRVIAKASPGNSPTSKLLKSTPEKEKSFSLSTPESATSKKQLSPLAQTQSVKDHTTAHEDLQECKVEPPAQSEIFEEIAEEVEDESLNGAGEPKITMSPDIGDNAGKGYLLSSNSTPSRNPGSPYRSALSSRGSTPSETRSNGPNSPTVLSPSTSTLLAQGNGKRSPALSYAMKSSSLSSSPSKTPGSFISPTKTQVSPFLPTSSSANRGPGRSPPGASPGSNLEEDDFDEQNAFQGSQETSPQQMTKSSGNSPASSSSTGKLDFTKRYRFSGDFPASQEPDAGDDDADVDINAWLLAQSEGNPLESSFGSRNSPSSRRSPSSPLYNSSAGKGSRHSPNNASVGLTSPLEGRSLLPKESPIRMSPASRTSPHYRYGSSVHDSSDSNSREGFPDNSFSATSPQTLSEAASPFSSLNKSNRSTETSPMKRHSPPATATTMLGVHPDQPVARSSSESPNGRSQSARILIRHGNSHASPNASPKSSPNMQLRASPGSSPQQNETVHRLHGSPLQRFSDSQDGKTLFSRTFQGDDKEDVLDMSVDEGSLSAGPGVFDAGPNEQDPDAEEADFVFASAAARSPSTSQELHNHSEVDGQSPMSGNGLASPDSYTRRYGKDTPPSSPGKVNTSQDSGTYGSDFEVAEDVDEDFVEDFEELEEEEPLAQSRSVRFKPQPVSDVYVTRDKYTSDEVKELFYTHDEALQFSMDYSKETHRAELAGQSWYDWWEARTEAQWEQDDTENGRLSPAWSDGEMEVGEALSEVDEENEENSNEFAKF